MERAVLSMDAAAQLQFRPPLALRLGLGLIGVLSAIAAVYITTLSLSRNETQRLIPAIVLLIPALLALALVCRGYVLESSEFKIASLGFRRSIPYSRIRHVDDSRDSVSVLSTDGHVTVAFLSPKAREQFLRALIERARLIRSLDPPYGIRARYIPRAKEITFIPHHARKKGDSDSGGVVSSE